MKTCAGQNGLSLLNCYSVKLREKSNKNNNKKNPSTLLQLLNKIHSTEHNHFVVV